jgi:GNAT superfamily N-acetyltransferase
MAVALNWRTLEEGDVPAMVGIAAIVHPDYFEDSAVLAERRALYPAGAFILEAGERPVGYLLSHPWRFAAPPPLNRLLGSLPERPSTFYLHDLALLPEARGTGAAGAIVDRLAKQAETAGFATLSLVAVNRSEGFWRRHGFETRADSDLAGTLAAYDQDARYMVRSLSGAS